jgi:hypothetical protein
MASGGKISGADIDSEAISRTNRSCSFASTEPAIQSSVGMSDLDLDT